VIVRRVLYSVAASLDGYIAGPEGEFDWIPSDPEIDWKSFMSRFDTVLMGRRAGGFSSAVCWKRVSWMAWRSAWCRSSSEEACR
jgi:hypothetical protein